MCSLRNVQSCDGLPSPAFESQQVFEQTTSEILRAIDGIPAATLVPSSVPLSVEGTISSEASATVSNASKALILAMKLRSEANSETDAAIPSHGEPANRVQNDYMTRRFIADVASLAEGTELYSRNASPAQNIEQLGEITDRVAQLRLALQPFSTTSSINSTHYQLLATGDVSPGSIGQDISPSMDDYRSSQRWTFHNSPSESSHTSVAGRSTSLSSFSDHLSPGPASMHDHIIEEDEILEMNGSSTSNGAAIPTRLAPTKNFISLQGHSRISLDTMSRDSANCSFSFEISGAIASLIVHIPGRRHTVSDAMPSASSGYLKGGKHINYETPSQVLQHYFLKNSRPIPHLLHPNVEGPIEEPENPYTITFKGPQYIHSEKTAETPQETTSLTYIFEQKQDQITLCKYIFGKSLLMISGCNKITVNGQEVSHMSAVTLWFDRTSQKRSVTFYPNLTGKKTEPKDVELELHGLWDVSKAGRSSSSLALTAELILRVEDDPGVSAMLERQSSAKSTATFHRRKSSTTLEKWMKPGKQKCVIEFTHPRDKDTFLTHLK